MSEGKELNLRELARKEPDAVRSVAERVGGEAGEWLQRILDEEADQ